MNLTLSVNEVLIFHEINLTPHTFLISGKTNPTLNIKNYIKY